MLLRTLFNDNVVANVINHTVCNDNSCALCPLGSYDPKAPKLPAPKAPSSEVGSALNNPWQLEEHRSFLL